MEKVSMRISELRNSFSHPKEANQTGEVVCGLSGMIHDQKETNKSKNRMNVC